MMSLSTLQRYIIITTIIIIVVAVIVCPDITSRGCVGSKHQFTPNCYYCCCFCVIVVAAAAAAALIRASNRKPGQITAL